MAGDFTGDGHLDLAVANSALPHRVGAAGQWRRHVPARGHRTRSGSARTAIVAGDFTGDGQLDLAVADSSSNYVSVLLGNGDGTFQPAVDYAVGSIRTRSWRATSPATAASTWPSPTDGDGTVSVLLGNGDGTFQPLSRQGTRWGRIRTPSWRATSPATAGSTWPSPTDSTTRVGPAGQRRRHFPAPGHLRGGVGPRSRSWRVTSTATAGSTWPSLTLRRQFCGRSLGAAGQRRRHVPTRGSTRRRRASQRPSWRVTSLATAVSTSPCVTSADNVGGVSVLLGNGDGTFQPAVQYAVGSVPEAIVAGDFNGDGRLDLAVSRRPRDGDVIDAAGQRRRHLPTRRVPYAVGNQPVAIWWRGTSPATAALDLAVVVHLQPRHVQLCGRSLGAPGQRRRHVPARGQVRGGVRPNWPSWRVTSTATAGSTSPWQTPPTTPSPAVMWATSRCCWATATAHSSPRSQYAVGLEPTGDRGG